MFPQDQFGFLTPTDNEFKHHNYLDMERFLIEYNESYPNITYLHSIGKSVRGRELYVLIISNTPLEHKPGKLKNKMHKIKTKLKQKKFKKKQNNQNRIKTN